MQVFIKALCLTNKEYNNEFLEKSTLLINFILQKSDYISKEVDIDINNLKKFDETKELRIPHVEKLEKLKRSVILEEKIISSMINQCDVAESLYTDFDCTNIEEILKTENQKFYNAPFLRNGKGDVIILSPSILVPFLIHNIIKLADKYGEKEKIIELYNDLVWNECKNYLNKLGNKKINSDKLNIKLIEDSNFYREALLSGDNKQICITIGIDNLFNLEFI